MNHNKQISFRFTMQPPLLFLSFISLFLCDGIFSNAAKATTTLSSTTSMLIPKCSYSKWNHHRYSRHNPPFHYQKQSILTFLPSVVHQYHPTNHKYNKHNLLQLYLKSSSSAPSPRASSTSSSFVTNKNKKIDAKNQYSHDQRDKKPYITTTSTNYDRRGHYNHKYKNKNNNQHVITIRDIQNCKNAFVLGQIVRNNPTSGILFYPNQNRNRLKNNGADSSSHNDNNPKNHKEHNHDDALQLYKVFVEKVETFQPNIKPKDISGLLNGLSKQRGISSKSRARTNQRYVMSLLADTALSQMMMVMNDDGNSNRNETTKVNKNKYNNTKNKGKAFTSRDISMIINALAKVHLHHDALFDKAATEAIKIMDTFNAHDFANILNGFAKMNHHHPELFNAVAEAAIPKIHTFNAQNLATTINAYAKMNQYHDPLFNAVANAAIPMINSNLCNAQNLSNIVNAFAKMNHYRCKDHPLDVLLLDAVAMEAIHIIDTFNAQSLSNTVNAFAKMNHPHPKLFNAVAEASIPLLDTFNDQNLSNSVNAFAKINHRHDELFNAVADAAIPSINTFSAQALSNTVNAFAKMNHPHTELFDVVAIAAIPRIAADADQNTIKYKKFNSQALASTVNAFSKLNHCYHHPKLFEVVAKAAITIIHMFKPQELSIIVNAFAKMYHYHHAGATTITSPSTIIASTSNTNNSTIVTELFDAVANASIPMIDELNAQALSNTVNAFAKINHPHDELFHAVATASISIMDTFSPQAMANTVNAFAKHASSYHPQLFQDIATAAIPKMDQFNAQALSNTVNAYARVKHHHNHSCTLLLDAVGLAAIDIIDQFNAQALANTVYAFAKMQHYHRPLFDSVALASIPIIDTFDAQNLATTASAFTMMNGIRNETSANSKNINTQLLFSSIAEVITDDYYRVNDDKEKRLNISMREFIKICLAFSKLGLFEDENGNNKKLRDILKETIIDKENELEPDERTRELITACFDHS